MRGAPSSPHTDLLEGYRVVDFTWALAGPFATMVLADLGADVAKLESELHVDSARLVGPYVGRPSSESSGYFRFFNRNKRSVSCDLASESGRALARDLVRHGHLAIENFRPHSLDAKGLGYGALSSLNPQLAMCSISGFGRDGPRSAWASYGGAMAECVNGLAMATGGSRPIIPGKAIADLFAGLYAALGTCGQLYAQTCYRRPSYIEVTQFEAGASTLDELVNVGPAPDEEHQVLGSDRDGWTAASSLGSWSVRDARSVALFLEDQGATQVLGEEQDSFLRLPAKIDGVRPDIRRRSPKLGEHTSEVVAEWTGH